MMDAITILGALLVIAGGLLYFLGWWLDRGPEPCLFCGSPTHLYAGKYGQYQVRCSHCSGRGPCFDNAERAINSWNAGSALINTVATIQRDE
jgi:hypothetical protein